MNNTENNRPQQGVNSTHRQQLIFRTAAINHYMRRQETPTFPRLISPPFFYFLWLVLFFLLASSLLAWVTEVPVYARALAVTANPDENGERGRIRFAVLLPAEALPRLRTGQRVFLRLTERGDVLICPITAIENRVVSPQEVREQFDLSQQESSKINEPTVVAWIETARSSEVRDAVAYSGSVRDAEVETGSRRIISFIW